MEGSGAEIESGLFEGGIHSLEAGLHSDKDEGKTKGDVGNDDGEVAEREREHDKEDEEADTHKNFGHDHGNEDESFERAMDGKTKAIEHPSAESAEDSGESGGAETDEQAIGEGVEEDAVFEEGLVPLKSETFPNESGL